MGQGKHGKSLCQEHKTALKGYKAEIKAILKIALLELAKSGKEAIDQAKEQLPVHQSDKGELGALDDCRPGKDDVESCTA